MCPGIVMHVWVDLLRPRVWPPGQGPSPDRTSCSLPASQGYSDTCSEPRWHCGASEPSNDLQIVAPSNILLTTMLTPWNVLKLHVAHQQILLFIFKSGFKLNSLN